MVKFVKKFEDLLKERSTSSKLKAMGMSQQALEGVYKTYFYSIEGFINGNPSKWQVWGLNNLVYSGLNGAEDKSRVRSIVFMWRKHKLVSDEDKLFLRQDLLPWFEASLKAHTKKVFVELMKDFDSKELDKQIQKNYKPTKGEYK